MQRSIVACLALWLTVWNGAHAQAADPAGSADASAGRRGRIDLLNPPAPGEPWWMREGKGYTLCEAVWAAFQKYTPDEVGNCPDVVALSVAGMRELDDGWVELDPREHGELYKSLMQYRNVGVEAYFGRRPEYFDSRKYSPEVLERSYQGFLDVGPRMRTITRQLFVHQLGDAITTYTEPQTILEIRLPQVENACPRITSAPQFVRSYYVTADLSGPDPRIRPYEAGAIGGFNGGRFIEYKGVIHLMRSSGPDIAFSRDFGEGHLQPFCEVQKNRAR